MTTPASLSRRQKSRRENRQNGTVLSYTVLAHPPARFGHQPRTIALIALDDGTKILAPLHCPSPSIGMRVRPRMRLSTVEKNGLRVYDLAFEELSTMREPTKKSNAFPGYILAFTGPSGVGKTTVQRLAIKMFAEYASPVPIVTTRKRKSGDLDDYRHVSKEKFAELLRAGKIVAATNIPSQFEDRWYGYRRSDLEAIWKQKKLPVVVTEMHLLQGLANTFGRRSILSFGLLPPGKSRRAMLSSLLHRLRLRGRETEQSIRDRVKNAARDLAFFTERRDLFDHLIVNDDMQVVMEALRKHIPRVSKR